MKSAIVKIFNLEDEQFKQTIGYLTAFMYILIPLLASYMVASSFDFDATATALGCHKSYSKACVFLVSELESKVASSMLKVAVISAIVSPLSLIVVRYFDVKFNQNKGT